MRALLVVLLPAVLILSGCGRSGTSPAPVEIDPDVAGTSLSGPYTHENLTVFLFHASTQDERDFLTLDEGLKDATVKITEKEREQVGELVIDNRSDRPLYIQEGERLQGGKQDRTVIASLVVPAHSGPTPLPTFCVEQSRWSEGARGRQFGFVANPALAPKAVRGAAKVEGNQQGVWQSVSAQKKTARTLLKTGITNSSINETFDAPEVRKVSDDYARALGAVVREHPDAVGVAVLVNNQFEEANVYPNHGVLQKLFPRLIQSYAVQAVMLRDQAGRQAPPSRDELTQLLAQSKEKSHTDKPIDSRNVGSVRELEGNRFVCTTRYDGRLVHWQLLQKVGATVVAREGGHAKEVSYKKERASRLGNDW
jgi:hypothetical protein